MPLWVVYMVYYGIGELFIPMASSFIPFSNGSRTRMGNRFAQAEISAIMAAVHKNYSVELPVEVDDRRYQERSTIPGAVAGGKAKGRE